MGSVPPHHHSAVPHHPRLQEKVLETVVHGDLHHVCSLDLRLHIPAGVDGDCCRSVPILHLLRLCLFSLASNRKQPDSARPFWITSV